MIVAYIDGGARGNPGPAGYGVRIENSDGTLREELRGALGVVTNNVAEYHGLIAALAYSVEHGQRLVVLRSDSQLLVKQMQGHYRVKHPGLQRLYRQAQELVARLDRVRFEYVPRSQNAEADRLANLAMDEAMAIQAPAVPDDPRPDNHVQAPASASTSGLSVIAIGMDATEIPRIEQTWRRYGDRFVRRIFTDHESAYCMRRREPAQHLAARFAAKEAAMKALGTGHSQGVLWRDIEVVRTSGPPQLQFHGTAARRADAIGCRKALLTLTHSEALALAQVLLLGP